MKEYKSPGKLILCGEYSLLNGGLGLSLQVNTFNHLYYKKLDRLIWNNIHGDKFVRDILQKYHVKGEFHSFIDWKEEYGFGSSGSTLANLCKFLNITPDQLDYKGSGIDIWTSFLSKPLLYSKNNPQTWSGHYNFTEYIFFKPLNKKVKSPVESVNAIDTSEIVKEISRCKDLEDFIYFLKKHDEMISKSIGIDPYIDSKALYSKYLGTWGGDTVMLIGKDLNKSDKNIIAWKDLIL